MKTTETFDEWVARMEQESPAFAEGRREMQEWVKERKTQGYSGDDLIHPSTLYFRDLLHFIQGDRE